MRSDQTETGVAEEAVSEAGSQASREPRERTPPRKASMESRGNASRPAAVAISDRKMAAYWRSLSLLVCLISMGLSVLIIRAGKAEDRILVLDGSGNVLSGPLEPLSESKGFFTLTALYCTHTALQRSSEGFDLYEMLRLYFSARAIQKLEENWSLQKEDAKARNLQQKPVVEVVGDPVQAGSLRVVETRGRLVRAGAYAGRSFYEEVPFVLVLSFRRNPDLGKAGAYPWICEQIDIETKEPGRD